MYRYKGASVLSTPTPFTSPPLDKIKCIGKTIKPSSPAAEEGSNKPARTRIRAANKQSFHRRRLLLSEVSKSDSNTVDSGEEDLNPRTALLNATQRWASVKEKDASVPPATSCILLKPKPSPTIPELTREPVPEDWNRNTCTTRKKTKEAFKNIQVEGNAKPAPSSSRDSCVQAGEVVTELCEWRQRIKRHRAALKKGRERMSWKPLNLVIISSPRVLQCSGTTLRLERPFQTRAKRATDSNPCPGSKRQHPAYRNCQSSMEQQNCIRRDPASSPKTREVLIADCGTVQQTLETDPPPQLRNPVLVKEPQKQDKHQTRSSHPQPETTTCLWAYRSVYAHKWPRQEINALRRTPAAMDDYEDFQRWVSSISASMKRPTAAWQGRGARKPNSEEGQEVMRRKPYKCTRARYQGGSVKHERGDASGDPVPVRLENTHTWQYILY
ncbi:uncharacterized protein LOC117396736 [Acipenser ruthenus]|uniref:uncharacterized protein LOC117396736 n=1 Tax=Acipenser ruthenus TaxID=7906 RepID=UPI0027422855|nr:uncharacterized protein LOC117396736 [Acipenser ruthenus]